MNRLLQGDVGSGKTMVALLSMLLAADNGYQSCLMAPTEILAQQHYHGLKDLLKEMPVEIALLTGSTKVGERRRVLKGLIEDSIHFVVGTHAVIEDVVQFKNLGLTDGVHRAGGSVARTEVRAVLARPYRQRELLDALGQGPSVATPRIAVADTGIGDAPVVPAPRILLVEDSLVNQKVATSMLRRLRCTVQIANNGREALTAMEAEPFDLVLMDCQMPVMDGFTATRERRQRETGGAPRLTIAAMTAHAMQGDRARCLAAGMDDYLTKPINMEQIGQLLERWLPGRASLAEGTAASAAAIPAPTLPTLDAAVLKGLEDLERDGSPGLVADVIDLFVEQSERHLLAITSAIADGRQVLMAAHLHALRGSASSVGASHLAGICASLETLPEPTVAALADGLGQLRLAYADARVALQSLRLSRVP